MALRAIHTSLPGLGVFGIAAAAITEIERDYRVTAQAAANALLRIAEQLVQTTGVPIERHLAVGLAHEIVAVHARYADLADHRSGRSE